MRRATLSLLSGVLLLLSAPLQALTLDEARSRGLVGETLSGYVAAVVQDSDTQALVKKINAARLESYEQLARSNNLKVDDVARLAGQKLVARAQPGDYVRGINGQWLRKD
ncbi:YdbL family protein [Enterobacteriaceae bacterium 4M9]|nr:YdbL family protein [Enterobacteriaceae bacterium 4M9]